MPTRYYTPESANRTLPLVGAIVRDIREAALELETTYSALKNTGEDDPTRDELSEKVRSIQSRFTGLVEELEQLGVELKDPFQGLIDFRARRGDDEVYLCWRLGEDAVGFWHGLEAGFRGRQPIETL